MEGDWFNPNVGDTLIDDKEKLCVVRQVREEGLVMRVAYHKAHWLGWYGVWVRRSGLNEIDWKPILYGKCTSKDSLSKKQRPILKNLQDLQILKRKLAVVQELEKSPSFYKPKKRMIQVD
jgi:hypothetical protein